jgi:hypothetical protein
MIRTLIILMLLVTNALATSVLDTSTCESYYKKNFDNKKYKLFSIYESQTLCGYVMDQNTFGFNHKGIAPNQKLSKKDIELLDYKGRWINIFSKDDKNDIVSKDLSQVGISKDLECTYALPVKNSIQCPKKEKDIFDLITKFKEENFIKKEFSP